jgi:hypothetical protein
VAHGQIDFTASDDQAGRGYYTSGT